MTGRAGLTPEQRKAAFDKLKPSVQKAYWALKYAETMSGRGMEDREAYDWLKENGIDQDKGDVGELADYRVPDSLETFRKYLTTAREALGESKYTRRRGRKHGGTIVSSGEIEYQRGEDE